MYGAMRCSVYYSMHINANAREYNNKILALQIRSTISDGILPKQCKQSSQRNRWKIRQRVGALCP